MKVYGLIGFPLGHSWSAHYFNRKFEHSGITAFSYKLFPRRDLSGLREWIASEEALSGLNVTLPYKIQIIPYLDHLSEEAQAVRAVNCIHIWRDKGVITLTGHNTDVFGFRESLLPLLQPHHSKALILGNGGASRAVAFVFRQLGIEYRLVSRTPESATQLSYEDLTEEILKEHSIIVNATPVGMYPAVHESPDIPYHHLDQRHLIYDLVYNPEITLFLEKAGKRGAHIVNGIRMLELQAEQSWKIWNRIE